MDLVKEYSQNEIFSAIVMFASTFYICNYHFPKFLIYTYLVSYLFFLVLGVNTLLRNFRQIIKPMNKTNNFSQKNVLRKFSVYGLISMIGTVASTGTGYLSIILLEFT